MDHSPPPHQHEGPADVACPNCLVKPQIARSAKYAWTVTAITVLVLVVVLVLGFRSRLGLFAAGGGLFLAMMLACPLLMGGMMWMMMHTGHQP